VVGWSPDPTERADALAVGALSDSPDDWRDAVARADLVVLATPLRAAVSMLPELALVAGPDSTFTDVVSLKEPMARAASLAGLSQRWVGSHPMAGSEKSGFAASRHDLLHEARVWTVVGDADADRVTLVERFWEALGGVPVRIGAGEHDRLMAGASHLPQLTATALVRILEDRGVAFEDLGPGGRDMTRLAQSDPVMWGDLLHEPPDSLAEGLRALAGELQRLAGLVENRDVASMQATMVRGGTWRRGAVPGGGT
jgi:prephenate dehydrogenase